MPNIKMLLLLGMTKIKMMKEEAGSADFVEKRRASLERYSSLTNKHANCNTCLRK